MKRLFFSLMHRLGLRITTRNSPLFEEVPRNLDREFLPIYEACRPFTMTSPDCLYAVYSAVKYVVANQIAGDVVECGVFKGGSIMTAAHALNHFGDRTRRLYLYDTFAGMTEPTAKDVDFAGRKPSEHLSTWNATRLDQMANCSLEDVRHNVFTCPYPPEQFVFVQGPVEKTIPATMPGQISILRLDTDWHESTKHELIHLFPLLAPGGVLIIDDYGFWQGAREAVDDYFQRNRVRMLLTRIDRAGASIGVKFPPA